MAATIRQTHAQWISAPLPPDKFVGPARVAWERAYPEMLGRYYALLEGVTGVGPGRAARAVGVAGEIGAGSSRGGEVGDSGVQQGCARRHAVGSTDEVDGGATGGAAVGAGVAQAVPRVGCVGRSWGKADDEAVGTGVVGAESGGVLSVDDGPVRCGSSDDKDEGCVKGKNNRKNRLKREKYRSEKRRWKTCLGDDGCQSSQSVSGSVQTVDTRTGVEIEAAQTLAARRVEENKVKIAEAKVAAKLAEHRLKALSDKERSLVIDRLAAARLEEKINTARKRSQASFKECGSPIDSVGSALSAHEFAFKQQVRQIDAEKKRNAYMKVQLDRYYAYSPDYVNQIIAEIPEPYIPTEQEMEEEDSDQSPFMSNDEMWEEANKYQHG